MRLTARTCSIEHFSCSHTGQLSSQGVSSVVCTLRVCVFRFCCCSFVSSLNFAMLHCNLQQPRCACNPAAGTGPEFSSKHLGGAKGPAQLHAMLHREYACTEVTDVF